jgi:hypothetical protein
MRSTLLALLVAAVSCSDFSLVEPEVLPQPAESLMSVLLRADRSDVSRYELEAIFVRGRDAHGQPIEVADRHLYVEGDAVQPTVESGGFEFWRYEWETTRTDGGGQADSLRIRPPVLEGASLPGLTVTIPIAAREGPADVTWAEGEDLRLRVSPRIGTTPQLSAGLTDWTLELGDTCQGSSGQRLFIAGQGTFPSEFRVPREWLMSFTPAPAAACLRAVSSYRVSDAPYRIDVFVELRLTWRIHMAGTS